MYKGWIAAVDLADTDREILSRIGIEVGNRIGDTFYNCVVPNDEVMAKLDKWHGDYIWHLEPEPLHLGPSWEDK